MREVKEWEIVPGMKCLYKNKRGNYVRLEEYEYSATIHPLAVYDATVIGVYDHHIVLNILVNQDTIQEMCFGAPTAYNWSIQKYDIGRTEHLYEV